MVSDRLKQLGKTAFAVETEHGLPADAIRNVLRSSKKAGPTLGRVEEICDALGLELYIGVPRETGPLKMTEVAGEKFAAVARYEAKAAAGGGAINFDDPPIDYLAFSRAWLESQDIRASSAVLLTVSGDSMAPTLNDGDLVMIDRSRTKLRSGHVYVFNDPENGTRLKRLQVLKGSGIMIRSDSPDQEAHPPEFRPADAADKIALGLIGEVVWSAHTWM